MVKKIISAPVILVVLLLACLPSLAYDLEVGEELHYTIKIVGIPAGSQVLKVEDKIEGEQGPAYVLSYKVESSGMVSLFFKMEDKIVSHVNSQSLYPHWVNMNIKENSRTEDIEVTIENTGDNIKATVWDKKEGEKKARSLSSRPLDMLSLIYWIRAQPLEVGEEFEVLLLDTPGSFKQIKFEITGVDKAYTYLGVFPALVCEQVKPKNGIRVWFSQGEEHLPLYIKIGTPLGDLTAILEKVKK